MHSMWTSVNKLFYKKIVRNFELSQNNNDFAVILDILFCIYSIIGLFLIFNLFYFFIFNTKLKTMKLRIRSFVFN